APTFFAGTFVRHPLAMAAVVSVLHHVKAQGPQLQASLTARATRLVERVNAELARCGISKRIDNFGSIFYVDLHKEDRFASLLFYHLRNRGVYIQEGFPCFLTTTHTDADVDAIVTAFAESLDELRAHGIFSEAPAGAVAVPAIVEVPPTEPQREIWLAAQLGDDASCAFNESVTLRLRGALDETAFEDAWRRIVARHESLRATFSHTGETMRIARDVEVPLRRVDLRDRPESEAEAILAGRIDTDARTPFDLVAGPLVRGQLVRLTGNTTAFVMTAHHIVCDGYSVNVVLDELAAAYTAVLRGEPVALPAPLAFSAYARQKAAPQAQSRAAVEAYWREQFAEPVMALELPADRARPAVKTFRGATRSAFIDRQTRATIRDLGKRNGSTLFVTLATAFHTLIGRLADRDDVVVGVPVAGQAFLGDGDILVGHCVHFLPVRAKWNRDTSIAELLGEVKDRVFGAYEHQDYTLGTLVRDLDLRRDVNRIPLAEVQFNVERLAGGVRLPDLEADVVPNAKAFVNFDLFLNVVDSDDGLRLDCDYSTDLFDAATIDRWLDFYRTLLLEMAADATQTASTIAYIAPSEQSALRDGLATPPAAQSFATVHALIEAQVAQRSAKTAVRFRGKALTYAELDARANRLARYLLARTGGSGALVGVCLERSLDTVIALLATHKAGCAYVPLDPSHPEARLRRILTEANVAALITDDSATASLIAPGVPLIDVLSDADTIRAESALPLGTAVAADDLAYVIYTSGSTGVPKGVEITHGSVVNLLSSMANEPGLTENDTFLAVTTVAFDIAGLELFLPLSAGATLTIAPSEETSDGFRLLVMIADATAMQATPATWRLLLEGGFVSTPGFVMLCGGEALPRELADRLLAGGGTLWNMYGPTETTIWSSCSRVLPGDAPITVGRPIANTTFYVLDHHDQLVPVGATGQLHIGGAGVARGYFKRPELTAERFISNPFGAGRLYRTGDSARVLADGTVQLFGRLDNQVKVRGFRIELGEIEAALERSGGLAAAVVTVREDVPGDQKLVAYYVARAGSPRTPETLRNALADELPRYMIPSLWVALDALPLSPSGKVDRAALPAPEAVAPRSRSARAQNPQTAMETALARIWSEVLHLERVSVDDDLFALGADSLQLFAITARANEQNIRLSAKELFRYPSIGALARRLDERVAS
ncbi:MAG TPA: amino acid adenylation domain-containing protein, partial [Candidatus Elarobacter sp.]|nr:amino acid adenylation domain-containing protein [Candidatus Elarobacter sp.]